MLVCGTLFLAPRPIPRIRGVSFKIQSALILHSLPPERKECGELNGRVDEWRSSSSQSFTHGACYLDRSILFIYLFILVFDFTPA